MFTATLLASLFVFITSRSYLEKRHQLAENLKNFIAQNEKEKAPYTYEVGTLKKITKVIFYGIERGKIDYVKKKFGLSDKMMNDIKAAPYVSKGIGNIYDYSFTDLSGDFDDESPNIYNEFRWCLGSAFIEDDITYFLLIDLKATADLAINGEKVWFKECRRSFIFKECWDNYRLEMLPFTPEQLEKIKLSVNYQMFKTISEHIPYIENDSIQAYISENNPILSDDGSAVAYIGNFGDIALGPTKYLNSIEPLKKYSSHCQGHIMDYIDGPFDAFCNDKDRNDISCRKVYGGMFVHKFTMLFDRVHPLSTMEVHRKQMEDNAKNGSYALVLYLDGEMEFRTSYKKAPTPVLWTSNTRSQGEAPFEVKVTNDYRLQLVDKNGKVMYQSGEYVKIPTILYGGQMMDAEFYDRNNGYQGGRMKGGVMMYLRMGMDDEEFPNLQVKYSIWSDGKWVTNTKPMQNLGGSRKYYAYSLKMNLSGEGSEKFKICYKTSIRNQKDTTRNRESTFVCNGQFTEWADFEKVSDYISGFEILILPANYNRIE